jgi:hypothetical protein
VRQKARHFADERALRKLSLLSHIKIRQRAPQIRRSALALTLK